MGAGKHFMAMKNIHAESSSRCVWDLAVSYWVISPADALLKATQGIDTCTDELDGIANSGHLLFGMVGGLLCFPPSCF